MYNKLKKLFEKDFKNFIGVLKDNKIKFEIDLDLYFTF